MSIDEAREEVRQQCIRLTGKTVGLTYEDVSKVTGYQVSVLYSMKSEGLLVPVTQRPKRFDYESCLAVLYLRG